MLLLPVHALSLGCCAMRKWHARSWLLLEGLRVVMSAFVYGLSLGADWCGVEAVMRATWLPSAGVLRAGGLIRHTPIRPSFSLGSEVLLACGRWSSLILTIVCCAQPQAPRTGLSVARIRTACIGGHRRRCSGCSTLPHVCMVTPGELVAPAQILWR